jgi:hypothetical protein
MRGRGKSASLSSLRKLTSRCIVSRAFVSMLYAKASSSTGEYRNVQDMEFMRVVVADTRPLAVKLVAV